MPWKEVKPMDQKLRFISDYLNGYFSITELCSRFGISMKILVKIYISNLSHGAG